MSVELDQVGHRGADCHELRSLRQVLVDPRSGFTDAWNTSGAGHSGCGVGVVD